jgi:hypothetical protein
VVAVTRKAAQAIAAAAAGQRGLTVNLGFVNAARWAGEPNVSPDGGKRLGATKPDIRQIDELAKRYGLTEEERWLLRKEIHREKEFVGRDLTEDEIIELILEIISRRKR